MTLHVSHVDALRKISIRCKEFVSLGIPLYKEVPWQIGGTFNRIKVRFRKTPIFGEALNQLAGQEIADRYVEATTIWQPSSPESSYYYMFPVDGYDIVWSPSRPNIIKALQEGLSIPSLRHHELPLAIEAKRDVIVFDLADYYIIHVDACVDYPTLSEAITSSNFEPMQWKNS